MMTESWFVGRLKFDMSTWRRTASRVNLQKIPYMLHLFASQKKYRHEKKNSWYLINPKCSSKFHPNPFHCSFFIPFLHKPFGNTLETSKTPRLGDASRGGGGGTQRLSRKSREKSVRPGAPSCGGSKCPDSNGSAMLEYQGSGYHL